MATVGKEYIGKMGSCGLWFETQNEIKEKIDKCETVNWGWTQAF